VKNGCFPRRFCIGEKTKTASAPVSDDQRVASGFVVASQINETDLGIAKNTGYERASRI